MKENILDKAFLNRKDSIYRLIWLFSRTRDVFIKTRQKELRAIGLTLTEVSFLFIVEMLNGASYEDISVWAMRELHSVSSQVGRMEKSGLLKKMIESRKNIKVVLTDQGKKALELSMNGTVIIKIMSSLSKEERIMFYKCLYKIRKESYETLGIYKMPPWP
jgi:DNA-binding MarR family transcriptional regulator